MGATVRTTTVNVRTVELSDLASSNFDELAAKLLPVARWHRWDLKMLRDRWLRSACYRRCRRVDVRVRREGVRRVMRMGHRYKNFRARRISK